LVERVPPRTGCEARIEEAERIATFLRIDLTPYRREAERQKPVPKCWAAP